MRIGIYNLYLNTFGGGEKYVGAIAELLSQNHDVDLITNAFINKEMLEKRLNLDLGKVDIRILPKGSEHEYSSITKDYDLFVNGTHMSAMPSLAKKSILICHFPFSPIKNLLANWLNRFKRLPFKKLPTSIKFLDTYDLILNHSKYSQLWVRKYWRKKSKLLYPPVDHNVRILAKENIILSVGRFFEGSHNKKHIPMIQVFRRLYDRGLRDWEYHLIGGTHHEPNHQQYLKEVMEEGKGYPIYVHTDIPFEELQVFYGKTTIFWHAAGFGECKKKSPERFEHFGITTVEAMSYGCVPIVIGVAGQLEIVDDGINGFLWETPEELIEKTENVIRDNSLQKEIEVRAVEKAASFNRQNFEKRLMKILGESEIL